VADKALSRAGMKVLTAENGKAGVEIFREHSRSISVVVLDLQMPVVGGEETLAELRQIKPDVPVILSSGFDESEAGRGFTGLKPASFLQKPYTVERLVQAVAVTLKRKR
jgi:DNA-binding NtrC family response regulator